MGLATQQEADLIVARVRKLADKYGVTSPVLEGVRTWYNAFRRLPEHGAMIALEAECRKVEADDENFS